MVDSWSRGPDQIQMYSDTIAQLLPAHRLRFFVFAIWSSEKKNISESDDFGRLSPCLTAVSEPNLITYLSDHKTGKNLQTVFNTSTSEPGNNDGMSMKKHSSI